MNRIFYILIFCTVLVSYADTTTLGLVEVQQARLAPASDRVVLLPKDWEGRSANLAELLARTPGVETQKQGGWGAYQTISVQGMGGQRLSVLIDGFPLNYSTGGTVDLGSISLADLASVELVKGGSWESGSSMGGVLMLTRKQNTKLDLNLQAGSHGLYKADIAQGWGKKWHFEAKAGYAQAENDFEFLDRQVAPYAPYLSQERKMDNADMLDFYGEFSTQYRNDVRIIEARTKIERETQGLPGREGLWNPNARWLEWRASTNIDYRSGSEKGCQMHGLRFFQRIDSLHWTALDPAFSGNSTSGGMYSQKGISLQERSQFSSAHELWDINASSQILFEKLSPQSLVQQGFPGVKAQRLHGALNGEFGIKPLAKMRLSSLVQLQSWRDSAQGLPTFQDHSWDFNLESKYRWRNFSTSIKGGTAIRIPGLSERYGSGAGTLGNPKLSPEKSTFALINLGMTIKIVNIGVNYFHRKIDSAITPVYSTGMVKFLNLSGARVYGLEQSLALKWTHFNFQLNSTFQQTRNLSKRKDEQNNLLPSESPFKLNQQISIPYGPLEFGWEARYWSHFYRDLTNFNRVPPGQEHDLWIQIKLPHQIRIRTECTNLANQYSEPVYSAIPAPGRRFSLNLIYQPS